MDGMTNDAEAPRIGCGAEYADTWVCDSLPGVVGRLVDSCRDGLGANLAEAHDLPSRAAVRAALDELHAVLFPGYDNGRALRAAVLEHELALRLAKLHDTLTGQISRAFRYACRQCDRRDCPEAKQANAAVARLFEQLPEIREMLKQDIHAAHERDPAARSFDEILLCYPGVWAIATHRLAHALHHENVPLIPRLWSEYAHARTGIDIHPGAHIDPGFFIDHGTGVVIGETAVLGANVTLYQGVTLGALAPVKGQALRGAKRHPTLEDNVVVYAGATILGGDTVIGKGATIGGNVWLTASVEPGVKVLMPKDELVILPPKKR